MAPTQTEEKVYFCGPPWWKCYCIGFYVKALVNQHHGRDAPPDKAQQGMITSGKEKPDHPSQSQQMTSGKEDGVYHLLK